MMKKIYHDEEFYDKYGIRLIHLRKNGSDIIVKRKRFRGPQARYELLFKKAPKHFSREDVENYKASF